MYRRDAWRTTSSQLSIKFKTPTGVEALENCISNLYSIIGDTEEIAIVKAIKELMSNRLPQSVEQLPVGSTKLNTVDNCQLTTDQNAKIDRALETTSDLINPAFKAWYASQARRLGVSYYLGIAVEARRGRAPEKLFSYLLKKTI